MFENKRCDSSKENCAMAASDQADQGRVATSRDASVVDTNGGGASSRCGSSDTMGEKENCATNCDNKDNKVDKFLCFECKRSLVNSPELINVSGQPCRRWHPECFKCMICREPMDKRQSCHVYEDQIVCRNDYLRLKCDISATRRAPIKCARCRWPIAASDWVRKAACHVYHLACFNCDICSRQLNTGEQYIISPGLRQDQDDQNAPVRLLCRLHFTIDHHSNRSRSMPAAAAEGADDDRAASSPASCQQQQQESNAHEQTSNADRCRQQATLNKRNNFICSQEVPSTSSGTFSILMQSEQRQAAMLATATSIGKDLSVSTTDAGPSATTCTSGLVVTSDALNFGASQLSATSLCPLNIHQGTSPSTSSSNNTTLLGCGGGGNDLNAGPMTPTSSQNSGGGSGGTSSKSKRVRTTFTEDQLSILQTHFQIDSNPDGQDLERIATITGLSKRVTQVWFQNSRARQKKYMIKRKPGVMHHHGGGGHHHHHGGGAIMTSNQVHHGVAQVHQTATMDMMSSSAQSDDDDDEDSELSPSQHFHRESLFAVGLEQQQQQRRRESILGGEWPEADHEHQKKQRKSADHWDAHRGDSSSSEDRMSEEDEQEDDDIDATSFSPSRSPAGHSKSSGSPLDVPSQELGVEDDQRD